MVDDPNWDDYIGTDVTDADGKAVGTVVDYDRDARTFYLEPSGEVDKNRWEALGWNVQADYEDDWEDLDYETWRRGESDLSLGLDGWPYTLLADRLEDDDGELQLR